MKTIVVSSNNSTQRHIAYEKAVELFGRKFVVDKPSLNSFTIWSEEFCNFMESIQFTRNLVLFKEFCRDKFTYGDGTTTVVIDEAG
jgi:hypothetical protein